MLLYKVWKKLERGRGLTTVNSAVSQSTQDPTEALLLPDVCTFRI